LITLQRIRTQLQRKSNFEKFDSSQSCIFTRTVSRY